ncbi:MAG: hypothetical protein IH608_03490 [Proteobacteria bacterium]|nr:hypothetical protein [Pseudomonadota bacterium]
MDRDKVIRVDFRKGRRPLAGAFGGGRRFTLVVFAGVLVAELLAVAALYPSAIASFFFGPTVIAVAVVCTVGARRALARMQVSRLHRRTVARQGVLGGDGDHQGRTLH